MTPFLRWLTFLGKWEGGTVDDPDDRGGRTAYGISAAAHPDVDLETLDPAGVVKIARESYWQPCGADRLAERAPCTAIALADWAFHSGVTRPVRSLQRWLDVLPDGRFGPQTLAGTLQSVDRIGDSGLAWTLNARRRTSLKAIAEAPGQAKFLRGWLARVDDLDRLLAENVAPPGA